MFKRIVFICLGLMSVWGAVPAWSGDSVMLQAIERAQDLSGTTVTFRFSELPEYEIHSGGQRVDLYLLGDVVAGDIGPLPEDERIIKVLLAGHRKGLLVSLLFRTPPAGVSLEKNPGKKELSIDCVWSKPHGARPGMAMYIKGMPVPQKNGTAVISGLSARFSKDWNALYSYNTSLEMNIPVGVYVPERMPLPEGPWYSGLEEVIAAARDGRWDEVGHMLEAVNSQGDRSVGFLTLQASSMIQAGKYSSAVERAERLAVLTKGSMLGEYAMYVNALALGRAGAYLEADLVLRSRPDIPQRGGLMGPYWSLLLAELAIQQGRPEQAGGFLARDLGEWPEALRQAVAVRRGDILAETGNKGAALEAYASQALDRFVSSTWRKAEFLFQNREYGRSVPLYSRVGGQVSDTARKGLVQWREGLALVKGGQVDDGVFQLKMIVQDYYETEAFDRARLALLDLVRQGKLSREQGLAGVSYARVAEHSRVRALRQEAMLKQALALYQDGNERESVQVLERFLHEFRSGELRPEGVALLAEVLPGVVVGLIDADEELEALVLVERNRDLLVNSRMEVGFLRKLATGFSDLALYTRAARVLQYLIDAGDPSLRREVYVPLAQTFLRLRQADRLERLVREYEAGFPRGVHRGVLRGLWAEALMDLGDVEGAVQALPPETAYGNPDLEQLLVRVRWAVQDLAVVASCLKEVELAENMHVYSSELFLRGEALVGLKRFKEAVPVFEALRDDPEVAYRARYRLAGTLLMLGSRERGRALFEALAADAGAGRWAALAVEALADLDLGALPY